MSIEKNIERIAIALENISTRFSAIDEFITPAAAPSTKAPAPPSATDVQQAPAPPAADAWTAKTADEMNDLVMIAYKRLGTDTSIRQVMSEFGITSLSELPVSSQEALLAKIKELV
jgi:hypothetical protein